ncbi:LysR family transcriptional regulator [Psychromonas antarctica]|uniref:LysR family transcriptional regulator n=1 Tax=Psychromonas antarctica TaxID=67573 RepID=UPI001EE7E012|nr:LysR family transcriptional regulator [Psychromonas antarctica]MCG6202829.1 LysR family transcriptional regulator [Psychromonas antarctica]
MTFNQLEIFVVVAELCGFTLAAQQLGISQSAVSHALKKLEEDLGVSLIERNKSQAELTAAGVRLLPRAREILGLSETIRQESADIKGLQLGSLRIGSFGPTSSLRLLPEILDSYRKQFPNIEVRIDEGNDQQVVQWLQERRVDVGFVVLPDERFDTFALIEDQIVALIPKTHSLSKKDKIVLQDLCHVPFILTEAGSAQLISKLFTAENLIPDIRYRTTQLMTTIALVAKGEGVALVAELALPQALQNDGYVVRQLAPQYKRMIGLGLHSTRQASPATQAFIKTAVQLLKKGNRAR